jgi:DNA invertase Pin-like site-specific DNA recombinase
MGYRRISSTGQSDRYDLPGQETDLRAYSHSTGHRLVRIETDGAEPGSLSPAERPGLLAALRAIEKDEADGLLVPGDLDRLARELIVQEAILSRVWKTGGVVHTTTRGEIPTDGPDDPMRTAIRQFAGVASSLDRALAAKRTRNRRKAGAAAGGYIRRGSPAFGQRSVDGELVADDREAAVIAEMRELREAGRSLRQIANYLNAAGRTPKRGGVWYAQTVSRVLARYLVPSTRDPLGSAAQ